VDEVEVKKGTSGPEESSSGKVDFGADETKAKPKVQTQRFTNLDDFNRAANSPAPNTRYEYGTYSWETDELGRVTKAEGKVALVDHGRVTTDGVTTTTIGNGPDAKAGDVGFHLIGNQFDGPINKMNVVPGNGKRVAGIDASNLNQGAYLNQFENAVKQAEIANPGKVEMKIYSQYNAGNTSTRPDSFKAMYRVDGGRWESYSFIHQPGG